MFHVKRHQYQQRGIRSRKNMWGNWGKLCTKIFQITASISMVVWLIHFMQDIWHYVHLTHNIWVCWNLTNGVWGRKRFWKKKKEKVRRFVKGLRTENSIGCVRNGLEDWWFRASKENAKYTHSFARVWTWFDKGWTTRLRADTIHSLHQGSDVRCLTWQ